MREEKSGGKAERGTRIGESKKKRNQEKKTKKGRISFFILEIYLCIQETDYEWGRGCRGRERESQTDSRWAWSLAQDSLSPPWDYKSGQNQESDVVPWFCFVLFCFNLANKDTGIKIQRLKWINCTVDAMRFWIRMLLAAHPIKMFKTMRDTYCLIQQ